MVSSAQSETENTQILARIICLLFFLFLLYIPGLQKDKGKGNNGLEYK